MNLMLWAETTGELGAGDMGCCEGTGSQEDTDGSLLRAMLHQPNGTMGRMPFRRPKHLLWEGVSLGPGKELI